MDRKRITDLTVKYVKGAILPEEQTELFLWVNSSETNKRRFEERIEEANILMGLAIWEDAAWEKEEQKLRVQWDRKDAEPGKPEPILRSRKYLWLAAASMLVIVAGGIVLWQSRIAGQSKLVEVHSVQDLNPGGYKATLTLANGSVIILDSVHAGTIAEQGSSSIRKIADGQLAYDQTKDKSGEVLYNVVSTPPGGQYKVILPDGSGVWLDAASSIRFPATFAKAERRVEITGEVYFEVSNDPTRPFHVAVNSIQVEVLGTHFNINAYADEPVIKTTLLEGSVRVAESIVLKPGQQAQLVAGQIKVLSNVDMEEVVAWKNGYFQFDDADIQMVMRTLARWYNVKVRFEGDIPKVLSSGIISRANKASDVLKVLQASGFHFRIEGETIIVTP
jgi:transmembrane sensor